MGAIPLKYVKEIAALCLLISSSMLIFLMITFKLFQTGKSLAIVSNNYNNSWVSNCNIGLIQSHTLDKMYFIANKDLLGPI